MTKKWEYAELMMADDEPVQKQLNDMGNEGWELVSTAKFPHAVAFHFKRLLAPPKKELTDIEKRCLKYYGY